MNRMRTVLAVGKKEFTEFTRYKDWLPGLIIWPLMFPIVYILGAVGLAGPDSSGLSTFKSVAKTSNYTAFIVVGVMVYMWVNSMMWTFGTFLRQEQRRGTLESLWLCPINKFDILLGGALVNILIGFGYVAVSMLEYMFIYRISFSGNLFQWLIIFFIMIPGVIGFGMIFASLVLWLKDANVAVQAVRGLVMVLCGISFPISVMPYWMQVLSKFFPFTYGIEAARKIMVEGQGVSEAFEQIIMCLMVSLVYLIIGRLVFVIVERKVKREGSLERF